MVVIGASGALGFALAARLGKVGVPVVVGSRSQERAEEAVGRLLERVPGGSFVAHENREAASEGEVVILTVPFRNQSETLTTLKDVLKPGQLVVDTTVPLAAAVSGRATRTLGVWQGSAAQQAQEMVPEGVRVISALHTVSAKPLSDLEHTLDEDVLICGDSKDDKRIVAALLDHIPGLRCVDCGRLEQSRLTEQLTALLIGVNARYKTHTGIHLTSLPDELWPQ